MTPPRTAAANGHRRGAHQPADWAATAYQPAEGTPLLACRCGGRYLDDDEGRQAHRAVFGHQPRPAKTPKENDNAQQ